MRIPTQAKPHSIRTSRLAAAACASALCVAAHQARADFAYNDFSSIAGLTLVGSAAKTNSTLLLTPAVNAVAGGVWYSNAKQDVSLGFEATMKIRIPTVNGGGADGFALVIQNTSPSALGGPGGGIGYGRNLLFGQPGIANSLAVEIDLWDNNGQWDDLVGSHISVQSRGTLENSPSHFASLGAASIPDISADGLEHTIRVLYSPGAMDIFLDGAMTPTLSVVVDLAALLALDFNGGLTAGQAWIGVTAATGAQQNCQSHELTAFTFDGNPIPAPAAGGLLAGLGILMRRGRPAR